MEGSPGDVSAASASTTAFDPTRYLWTPVTIFNTGQRFQTTYETLQKYPGTQLAKMFSPPYPLFDEYNQAHIIPATLCPDARIFSYILEFLRTDQWIMPQDPELYEAVSELAAELELPSRPPQMLGTMTSTYRYEHQTVRLPVPIRGGSVRGADSNQIQLAPAPLVSKVTSRTPTPPRQGLASRTVSPSPTQSPRRKADISPPYDPNTNTAAMLTLLGYKGFTIVAEQRTDSKFTTEVTLRRKLPDTKGIEMLAESSPLFQRLLNIV